MPFLPLTKQEMEDRGWDRPDIVVVTGDAYVDHPSFGTAIIGRVLEDAGFRVCILSQPQRCLLYTSGLKRLISLGWRTSRIGAFPASCGGGTAFRPGTARTVAR